MKQQKHNRHTMLICMSKNTVLQRCCRDVILHNFVISCFIVAIFGCKQNKIDIFICVGSMRIKSTNHTMYSLLPGTKQWNIARQKFEVIEMRHIYCMHMQLRISPSKYFLEKKYQKLLPWQHHQHQHHHHHQRPTITVAISMRQIWFAQYEKYR